jgi:hypothetical protein
VRGSNPTHHTLIGVTPHLQPMTVLQSLSFTLDPLEAVVSDTVQCPSVWVSLMVSCDQTEVM